MQEQGQTKFVVLAILDGWGLAAPGPGNAIANAPIINMGRFMATYPHTQLIASGESVGLPRGEAGNTETGHLNLGAGRVVYQDLVRINMAIADDTFFTNPSLVGAFNHAIKNNSSIHFMGLVGAGGVHSNIEHLYALIELAKRKKIKNVFVHVFTDGRDSPPTSAKTYLAELNTLFKKQGIGQIASIMGRYWAMDRDLRWDRTEKAYNCLTKGTGNLVKTPEEVIDASYSEGKTDEFIEPSLITDQTGKPVAIIKENDSVVFFNFRVDRPRQLTRAFVLTDFTTANSESGFDPYAVKYSKTHLKPIEPQADQLPFARGEKIKNLFFVTMTEYSKVLLTAGAVVAFPPAMVQVSLGRVISEAGYKQLRAAESEKERFVTFYFSGQAEIAFEGEDRIIVPSPKIATYDLKPEMSAYGLTDAVLTRLREVTDYKFILINFANVDMVGHTGNIGSATKAVQVVDECLGKIASWVEAYGGTLLITADHGNAEEMIDAQSGEIETEHSANPVPFIAISKGLFGKAQTLTSGILADVAPTVLKLLNIEVPTEMTGRNLLENLE